MNPPIDVLIVGGGPAGLSAALVLARARHSVIVCDEGNPRNARSHGLHGYLTRDGILPPEFLELARTEVNGYGPIVRKAAVKEIRRDGPGFLATIEPAGVIAARRILIATGVVDRIPHLEGVADFYGKSVHHCPFCDGWEWRDRALAVYGKGRSAYGLALGLLTWSHDVAVLSDGPSRIPKVGRDELRGRGIILDERPIERLEGADGLLSRVVFRDGQGLNRDALFFSTGNQQACVIAKQLGCRLDAKGSVPCDRQGRTSIPGVYVAGDASRDVQFVIVAAAEGAKAAVAIHKDLVEEVMVAGRTAMATGGA